MATLRRKLDNSDEVISLVRDVFDDDELASELAETEGLLDVVDLLAELTFKYTLHGEAVSRYDLAVTKKLGGLYASSRRRLPLDFEGAAVTCAREIMAEGARLGYALAQTESIALARGWRAWYRAALEYLDQAERWDTAGAAMMLNDVTRELVADIDA